MKNWMIWHFKIVQMMVHYAMLGDALSVRFFVKTLITNLFIPIKQLRCRDPVKNALKPSCIFLFLLLLTNFSLSPFLKQLSANKVIFLEILKQSDHKHCTESLNPISLWLCKALNNILK